MGQRQKRAGSKKASKEGTKLTRKILKFSIQTNDGIVTKCSRELNVSRQYIYRMIKKWKLEPIVEECRTRTIDKAMDTIDDNLDDVDVALKYLAIKARQEIAKERQKVTIEGDSGLKITVENGNQAQELKKFLDDDDEEDKD